MSQDMGASADADRAGGLRPEPLAASQPEALIPLREVELVARAIAKANGLDPEAWGYFTQYAEPAIAAITKARGAA